MSFTYEGLVSYTALTATTTSSSPTPRAVSFGAIASHVLIDNQSGLPYRFALSTDPVASTGDALIPPYERRDIEASVTAISVISTSTATSTGGEYGTVHVSAWG